MPRLVITDANASQQIELMRQRLRGKLLYGPAGCYPRTSRYGELLGVVPASFLYPRIPRSDWKRLIEEGQGTFLGDMTKDVLPPHDQGSTNYCWAHGSVRAVEALRVYEGQLPRVLSAESIAVPITGGRNRGGSSDEALDWLRKYGACDQSFWPLNDLNIKHAKVGWDEDRFNHVIISWLDVENFDDQMTLALHRVPVAIGLGWWQHLVCQLDPFILDDGTFGIGADNSWGADYGENGRFYLDEKHGTANLGAFAPISETFSLS
jgi:hypothetical protein